MKKLYVPRKMIVSMEKIVAYPTTLSSKCTTQTTIKRSIVSPLLLRGSASSVRFAP